MRVNTREVTFTAEERDRATRAREVHNKQGHPSSDVLIKALDNGVYEGMGGLTGRDVRNADMIFGTCEVCAEAKMTAPTEPTSDTAPASRVGQVLYIDLLALTKEKKDSLGGYRQWLVGRDEKSSMPFQIGMQNKTQKSICDGIDVIVAFFNQYGHRVDEIVFDNEITFVACGIHLKKCGIKPSHTPSHSHNKRAERLVREVKDKMRCLECALPYDLPDELYGEKLAAAVEAISTLPNTSTGPTMTPYQIVTGRRPRPRSYAFGTPGICHSRRDDKPDQRAEWCLYMSGTSDRDHRVYIPQRKLVFSRRKYVEMEGYPEDWGYKRRIRIVATKKERQVEKLKYVEEMQMNKANTLVQEMTDEATKDTGSKGVAQEVQVQQQQQQQHIQQNIHVQQIPANSESGESQTMREKEQQSQREEQQRQQEQQREQQQQEQQQQQQQRQRDEEDRGREDEKPTAVVVTVSPEETQQSEGQGGMPSYQKKKTVKIVEPRVTRSMTRKETDASYADDIDDNMRAYMSNGVNEEPNIMSGFENDEKTREWITGELISRMENIYTADELRAYTAGVMDVIPIHNADAWIDEILCYRVGLTEAMKEQDPAKKRMILEALDEEVQNLVRKTKAVIPVNANTLSRREIADRIPGHTFLKFKELANGDFERVKARTVAGGNQVDPETVGETKAPTVGIMSVMALISMATSIAFEIRSADIEGAFLIPELRPGSPKRHILVDRVMSQRYCELYPGFTRLLDAAGKLTLELRRYLYGLPEAAYEFYQYTKNYLVKEEFIPTREDPCVFHRRRGGCHLGMCSS